MDATPSQSAPAPAGERPRRWRVSVSDSCIGSGICAGIARRYFRLGNNEQTQPVEAEIAPADLVLDAAASCPMEAITVTDAETGEVIEA